MRDSPIFPTELPFLHEASDVANGGSLLMKSKFPDLVCATCGSNRFKFPRSADDAVSCEDCGTPVALLGELQDKIANGGKSPETRRQRSARHSREVADSHERLRASVAETDRLIVASNEMIRRHRREDQEAGD